MTKKQKAASGPQAGEWFGGQGPDEARIFLSQASGQPQKDTPQQTQPKTRSKIKKSDSVNEAPGPSRAAEKKSKSKKAKGAEEGTGSVRNVQAPAYMTRKRKREFVGEEEEEKSEETAITKRSRDHQTESAIQLQSRLHHHLAEAITDIEATPVNWKSLVRKLKDEEAVYRKTSESTKAVQSAEKRGVLNKHSRSLLAG